MMASASSIFMVTLLRVAQHTSKQHVEELYRLVGAVRREHGRPDSGTAARIGTAHRIHHFARHHRDGEELLYATRSRSRSEYGSISTTIFLTAALGALRRPTVFIVMKPAASNLASVRVRFGCARPVMVTNSATDRGLRSRIRASSRRLSGVSSRTTASTELKVGRLASAGAGFSPRATAFISSRSDRRP